MKIQIKNLGPIQSAEFEVAPLTILCGKNNSGKTYITTALYGYLSKGREYIPIDISLSTVNELRQNGRVKIDISQMVEQKKHYIREGLTNYCSALGSVFSTERDHFNQCLMSVENIYPYDYFQDDFKMRSTQRSSLDIYTLSFMKEKNSYDFIIELKNDDFRMEETTEILRQSIADAVNHYLFRADFPTSHYISSDRAGLVNFHEEIEFLRNNFIENLAKRPMDVKLNAKLQALFENYKLQVRDNLNELLAMGLFKGNQGSLITENPGLLKIFEKIAGGEYDITDNGIRFMPRGGDLHLDMNNSSSTVLSLVHLGLYLKHYANKGDLLIIDEPELSLHPENQRRMARFLALLSNLGVQVFVTTHSDYFVKEINTLISLHRPDPRLKELAKREGYSDEELLDPNQIRLYMTVPDEDCKNNVFTLKRADIDEMYGIEVPSFDDTLEEMNRINSEIIWG